MSVPLQQRAVTELTHEGRYLYPPDVVEVAQRYQTDPEPGVPRAVVDAYADAVLRDLGPRAPYTPQRFGTLLDGRITDVDVWLPGGVHEVGPDRLSVFPRPWHDRLAGVGDPAEYVSVLSADLARARGTGPGAPPPVPKSLLLDAMTVLGRMDRSTAAHLVNEARLTGRIRVDPFQNPDADVRLVQPSTPPDPGVV